MGAAVSSYLVGNGRLLCEPCQCKFNIPAFALYATLPASPGTAHLAEQESCLGPLTRCAGSKCSLHWDQLPGVGSGGHKLHIKSRELCEGEENGVERWDDHLGTSRLDGRYWVQIDRREIRAPMT